MMLYSFPKKQTKNFFPVMQRVVVLSSSSFLQWDHFQLLLKVVPSCWAPGFTYASGVCLFKFAQSVKQRLEVPW